MSLLTMSSLTISQCLVESTNQLKQQSDTARLDCEVLLSHVLDRTRTYLYTWPEKELTDQQQNLFLTLFERRLLGEPIAHLTGEKEFWSLSLLVNNTTLIPRPETELLVELALSILPEGDSESQHVADLGTGTGAIACAIATERPHWQVWAYEKYPDAFELATSNQKKLALQNLSIQQSDWFDQVGERKFHLIVSNPPYIDAADVHLQQGDVRYEPQTALIADDNGLSDIALIIQQASNYLFDGGFLLLEHGYQQAGDVKKLLQKHHFSDVFTTADMAGHPRVTAGRLYRVND
ncbi:MAG: peptide chain release factor N(5)-glutamine methyltransferase [Cellvibrionaceae bacterium]